MKTRTIPKTKLDFWRRLCAEATPGPWTDASDGILAAGLTAVAWASSDGTDQPAYLHYRSRADRDFFVVARDAVPALLAEREDLLARLRALDPVEPPDALTEEEWNAARANDPDFEERQVSRANDPYPEERP